MTTNQLLDNRYRIIKKLQESNFSITYQGEDTRTFNRPCLIKQLNTYYNQELQQRFEKEAKILAKLGNHPQIPDLYDYFSENNQFYLIQEWIAGRNLEQIVEKQGKLTEIEVKDILIKLLPVLEFIHRQHRIVHRDIKPTNIMFNSENLPILIDFGIVKEIVTSTNAQIPGTARIGTPAFMASEQRLGKPVFASDIYSIGLTAIYLLTGKISPYKFSWRSDVPNISQQFADILDKSIEEKLSDRYKTATEMLTAIKSSKTSYQGNSRWLKIGIVAIIVGIIITVTLILYKNKGTKPTGTPTPEITVQDAFDAATQKAESAISKAKTALEKAQLETARDELQIAIQELENIPQSQGIDNQIQTKQTEYLKIINQINQALQKQPCYELLFKIDTCQEYPIKLD